MGFATTVVRHRKTLEEHVCGGSQVILSDQCSSEFVEAPASTLAVS